MLKKGTAAIVREVQEAHPADAIGGEMPILGGDPLLVQVGFTRFALRRAEAGRVRVALESAA